MVEHRLLRHEAHQPPGGGAPPAGEDEVEVADVVDGQDGRAGARHVIAPSTLILTSRALKAITPARMPAGIRARPPAASMRAGGRRAGRTGGAAMPAPYRHARSASASAGRDRRRAGRPGSPRTPGSARPACSSRTGRSARRARGSAGRRGCSTSRPRCRASWRRVGADVDDVAGAEHGELARAHRAALGADRARRRPGRRRAR